MNRPMRLGNRAMKEEKARKLLAECEYALFTTVDEEGAPHTRAGLSGGVGKCSVFSLRSSGREAEQHPEESSGLPVRPGAHPGAAKGNDHGL